MLDQDTSPPTALAAIKENIFSIMREYSDLPDAAYRQKLKNTLTRLLFGSGLDRAARSRLFEEIYNRTRGLDLLQPLMDKPEVTEIMVNGTVDIFYEEAGKIRRSDLKFEDRAQLENLVQQLFSRVNRNLSLHHPIADARLPDGSRANAVLPPAAPDGPILTLRKFTGIRPSPEALIKSGFISAEALYFLRDQIRLKRSIFIAGGTGTGKTTLLNILAGFIPVDERIITIEDSAELKLNQIENLVRLESRPPGPDGSGEITIQDLLRSSLRMRPDRIIIGEVRGSEAADLMHAMNTGHPGSLCTGHGNSCADMFHRLCNLALEGSRLPLSAIEEIMAGCIDIMVHISRTESGQRKVDEMVRLSLDQDRQACFQTVYTPAEGLITDPRGNGKGDLTCSIE